MNSPRFVLPVTFLLGASLAACGGDDGGDGDGGNVDAPPAATMLTVSGEAQTVSGTSTEALEGATIEAYRNGSSTPLGTATSGADGTYAITLTTDGTAIDGYLKGTSAGLIDNYLYPPRPLAADRDNATILLISQSTLGLLGTLGGVTQDSAKGFVGVLVLDAAGNGVAGATVTISPMGTARILYARNSLPNQSATETDESGTVYIANTDVGTIMVDAQGGMGGGVDYYEHPVNARAGVITTTAMEPK
ncbi:MAG: hypothetical protein F9K40_12220 [Kofleriaceae bacterium]|nr:MAG: hypothetical protein F9K40_12220 [Kofleriaceae bacterium]MBZ0231573.1 hypothetical protein [Kofleriaceae bacterium]